MKKFLLGFLILTGVLTAALVYERFFLERTFGPSAILTVAIAGGFFLVVLATFLLYETRYRETTANLWMAGISITVTYLILDLAAGFFLIQPLSPALVPDDYRHHKLVPNSYSRIEQRDFSYVQRVNNLGLRGRDLPAEKPANSYRILMLGDSFTMGKGVKDDETFSVLLEKSLNQRAAACGGRSFEVLNGGVDSYSPILSLIQLTRDLQPLNPDMVVLNLDVSDLVQEAAYRQQAVKGAQGEITAVPAREDRNPSLTERIRGWTERRLFFTRALMFYVNQMFDYTDLGTRNVLTQANPEVAAHTLAQDTVPRDGQWRDIFESIVRIKTYSAGQGIDFLLSIYPWPHQVSDSEWIPGRYTFMSKDAVPSDKSVNTIRELAAKNDVQLIDLFPAFRAYRGTNPLYFSHDMHWTATGQETMAKGLMELLEGRLPLCR